MQQQTTKRRRKKAKRRLLLFSGSLQICCLYNPLARGLTSFSNSLSLHVKGVALLWLKHHAFFLSFLLTN